MLNKLIIYKSNDLDSVYAFRVRTSVQCSLYNNTDFVCAKSFFLFSPVLNANKYYRHNKYNVIYAYNVHVNIVVVVIIWVPVNFTKIIIYVCIYKYIRIVV